MYEVMFNYYIIYNYRSLILFLTAKLWAAYAQEKKCGRWKQMKTATLFIAKIKQ